MTKPKKKPAPNYRITIEVDTDGIGSEEEAFETGDAMVDLLRKEFLVVDVRIVYIETIA